MDFEPLLAKIARHTEAIANLKRRTALREKKLATAKKKLFEPFISICNETAAEYNSTIPGWSIAKLGIDGLVTEVIPCQIHLFATLCDSNGHEPDEEFDHIEDIQSLLAPIFNRKLQEAEISFICGSLRVPSEYYTK